jgi:hypothetical protein
MVDYTKIKEPRNDRQLLDQFINNTHSAFQAYKMGSSINRTLLNCEFKKKEMTEDEEKINEVIEFERNKMKDAKRKRKERRMRMNMTI